MSIKVGFANDETWHFLQNIYDNVSEHYETSKFERPTWPLPVWRGKMSHWMLRREMRNFINAHDVSLFEWASALLKEASLVADSSSGSLVTRLHRYEMFGWVDDINWHNVRYAILDTEAMRQKLLERTSLPADRTVIIPPVAIEPTRINTASRPFGGKIGILCNLLPRKRVYELILAFHALAERHPALTLHIGGPMHDTFRAYYESMQFLVKKLGLEDRVTWYGRVEDRWAWYREMDVYISNSYSEGMQVAPLEAAASGCYCLTHWWEGADEIFPSTQLYLSEGEFVTRLETFIAASQAQQMAMREPMFEFVRSQCNFDKITREVREVLVAAA